MGAIASKLSVTWFKLLVMVAGVGTTAAAVTVLVPATPAPVAIHHTAAEVTAAPAAPTSIPHGPDPLATTTTTSTTTTTTQAAPPPTSPPTTGAKPPARPATPKAKVAIVTTHVTGPTIQGAFTNIAAVSGIQALAAATGARLSLTTFYLDGSDGWADMDSYQSWLYTPWKGAGYQMVLGVPIIPTSGGTAVGTLAAGAAGSYNSYFVTLAQTLVSAGFGNAILRPGWEFNVPGYAWTVSNPTDAANYAAFYQNIVNSMRTVAGQAFKFVWDGPLGSSGGSWTAQQAWPGAADVDYIGNDTYDQTWTPSCGLPFNNTSTTAQAQCVWANGTLPILNEVESFARSVGKPVVFPEWGLSIRPDGHGLGDDPVYIDEMGAWMANAANDVAWASYFDYDQGGGYASEITDGNFPNALAAFRATFG